MNFVTNSVSETSKITFSKELDLYNQLMEQIHPYRVAVLNHPIYAKVSDLESLRVFMKSHVFAVWDNMTLLKTLQRRLSCVDLPWLPPMDMNSARLVNEIVLVEETDEITPGCYMSHVDFYIVAMEEIGADSQPIQSLINSLREGISVEQALTQLSVPEPTKNFVIDTLKTAKGLTHEVAASFLLGREDIATPMFQKILAELKESNNIHCETLCGYIDRHTQVDDEQHAPMARQLLKNLCGNDVIRWSQALNTARSALQARKSLWDGINQVISNN